MSKKSLIVIIVAILLIAVAVVLYFVLGKSKDNLDYTELTNEQIQTTIKVGVPKEKGIESRMIGSQGNMVEYVNEENGYRITSGLYERSFNTYDMNKETAKQEEGFKEIKINKFEGYEYNSTSFSKIIVLSLGQTSNDYHAVYEIDLTRTKDYEEPLEDLINSEDIQTFINSIKLVDYVGEVIENPPLEEPQEPQEPQEPIG